MKTFDWPTKSHKFWWMEYQKTRRSKKRILLVTVFEFDGSEFITPHLDYNLWPKSICDEWSARFMPCTSPPIFPDP